MPGSMYIRNVKFGIITSGSDIPEFDGHLFVPTILYSRSDVIERWAEDTDVDDRADALKELGIAGGGGDYYFPGNFTGENIHDVPDYDLLANELAFNSFPRPGVLNSERVAFQHPEGKGRIEYVLGSGISFYDEESGVSSYANFVGSAGWAIGMSVYWGNYCGMYSTLFITEDGYVGFLTLSKRGFSDRLLWLTLDQSERFITWLETLVPAPDDPYEFGGGSSGPGGGPGSWDNSSDNIDFPGVPTLTAVDAGFITIYKPTLGQLNNLASWMWSSSFFDLSTWQHLFADPMECIIGCHLIPVDPPIKNTPFVHIGNITTDVVMDVISNQFFEKDCGSIDLSEYWGAYLDYAPYTRISIFLPFIGTRDLDTDELMPKTIHVKYNVDVLSGSCVAFVKVSGKHVITGDAISSVLYNFSGNCATEIPFTSSSFADMIRGAINIATTIGSGVAHNSAPPPPVAGDVNRNKFIEGSRMASDKQTEIQAVGSAVENVMSMKPDVSHSGSISSSAGYIGLRTPYLIIKRPVQCVPAKQSYYTGYPSFCTVKMADLVSRGAGFCVIHSIHLEGIPCTSDELSEIEDILKGGVIF